MSKIKLGISFLYFCVTISAFAEQGSYKDIEFSFSGEVKFSDRKVDILWGKFDEGWFDWYGQFDVDQFGQTVEFRRFYNTGMIYDLSNQRIGLEYLKEGVPCKTIWNSVKNDVYANQKKFYAQMVIEKRGKVYVTQGSKEYKGFDYFHCSHEASLVRVQLTNDRNETKEASLNFR